MKKLQLYILIILISTNLFVPLNLILQDGAKLQLQDSTVQAEDCTILSAVWNPAGEQDNEFFIEQKTEANIILKTKNCVGSPGITLTVF